MHKTCMKELYQHCTNSRALKLFALNVTKKVVETIFSQLNEHNKVNKCS